MNVYLPVHLKAESIDHLVSSQAVEANFLGAKACHPEVELNVVLLNQILCKRHYPLKLKLIPIKIGSVLPLDLNADATFVAFSFGMPAPGMRLRDALDYVTIRHYGKLNRQRLDTLPIQQTGQVLNAAFFNGLLPPVKH